MYNLLKVIKTAIVTCPKVSKKTVKKNFNLPKVRKMTKIGGLNPNSVKRTNVLLDLCVDPETLFQD